MNDLQVITKFETYLLTKRRVAKNTFDAYNRDLKQFAIFLKKRSLTFKEVTLTHLKDFLKVLKDSGLSAKSMARKISCIKTFYLFLFEEYDWHNVAQNLVTPRIEQHLPLYLTEKEIAKLFKAAEQQKALLELRNKVMLYTLYTSGVRISELVGLKTSDIDFHNGFLIVRGKGSKERMVPLPQDMLSLLSNYLDTVYPELLRREGQKFTTDILFPTYYAKKIGAMTRQSFWMYIKRLTFEADIKKDISPHSLRHSLATHLLQKGANLRSLQLLLGHEKLNTVEIYTHVETSHLRKIYDDKHPRS